MTTRYKVCCEATQDNDVFDCDTPQEAVRRYLDGYGTVDVDGKPEAEGVKYSTLNVWSGPDDEKHELRVDVIADGRGGVK